MNFKEHESSEKLRGGYYTESALTEYLLRWVRGIRPTTLLEPSCGDGAFFHPLLHSVQIDSLKEVVGFEIERDEAKKAGHVLAGLQGVRTNVEVGDFLAWVLQRINAPPDFDAVVGNPPFIRYQYLTEEMQSRAEVLIRHFGLRFTRHTNAWVPFVVAALNRVRPGGRLGMVVPSELLHVLHADSIRNYLLQECARIVVLDPEELWFEQALQGVVLLLAEKRLQPRASSGKSRIAVTPIRGRQFLNGSPEEHFDNAAFIDGESLPSKWTFALLSARERSILARLSDHASVRTFKESADVQVGIVTGANAFFLVPDDVVQTFDLGDYAYPMFGRSDHVAGVIYDRFSHAQNRSRGVPTNFLWFRGAAGERLGGGAARYVATGEAQGLHRRYKCRIRTPWYSVPSVFSSPVGMLKRSHDYPRLVLNSLRALTTDTAYRIEPRNLDERRLVYSFVNSLTALTAELEGRHYGGGVLELVPSEINRLLLPLPERVPVNLEALDLACRQGKEPREVFELQDRVLLRGIGLSPADVGELQAAWWRLRNRRQRLTYHPVNESNDAKVIGAATPEAVITGATRLEATVGHQ